MMVDKKVKLVECPRDAMQGWPVFIPTAEKIIYLQSLLNVGFHTLDFGSFVSPRAIPQMADTNDVLAQLDLSQTQTKLLAIVANERGAEAACASEKIRYLGFPFSISETFQQRNTNAGIGESLQRVTKIQEMCVAHNKELVVYISMGFGNPYGDVYNTDIVFDWVDNMASLGIHIISLADTVGMATAEEVANITQNVIKKFPAVECGVHLHAEAHNWQPKFDAALNAGCRRFDGALKGIGGCPMAGNDLVGNMNMENMIARCEALNIESDIDKTALQSSLEIAGHIFHS
ncbi:MAG: hydroxymethylglutaryl-CoA lyase [Ferruginibacter sp.]